MYFIEKIKKLWLADPKRLIVHSVAWTIGSLFLVVILSSLISPQPRIIVAAQSDRQSVTKPLLVRFLIPPSHKNLKVVVEPEIPVSISWSGGFFGHFARTMIITPDSSWEVNVNYSVIFSDLGGAVGFGRRVIVTEQFTTQTIPDIETISVSSVKSVLADAPIKISLTQSTENFADFFFTFSPPVEFTATLEGDSYTLSFDQPLKQGQEYVLIIERQLLVYDIATGQIERRLKKEVISKTKFTTKAPALINSFSPQGGSVLVNINSLVVVFNEPMNRQSVTKRVSLSPSIPGIWSWLDSKTLKFIPSNTLTLDTSYQLTIKSGAKAISGSYIEGDSSFSFKTVGNLRVIKTAPTNGSLAVELGTNISITFDQPVVRSDIEGKISISPTFQYIKSWSGNRLTINPVKLLNYHTKYTVTIGSGARSQYGKLMTNGFSMSFTTQLKKVILNIPLDRQDRALSCEAAALKMALNYRGLNITESNIMAIVGYDPTIKNGNVWGDPNVAYVGNIDGRQNSTGYGVHWDPIARAASNWRQAKAFSGWTVAQLAGEIEAGNPVIIWGVLGSGYSDPWVTPGGKQIAAWKGEHVRTLIGYTGSPDNPASFIINDPIVGRITWSVNTLKNDWAKFNNSGVVVY